MAQDVALVTGASSGIGEALARRIARDGRHARAGRAAARDRLEALARELRARRTASTSHAIASRPDRARRASAALVGEVGRRGLTVDWLVNNAGFGTVGRFHELPVERELEEIRLNVEVLVELTGRFLPAMVARGRGVVMNVASVGGFAPEPVHGDLQRRRRRSCSASPRRSPPSCAARASHVLCVCPGFTRTEFQEQAPTSTRARCPGFVWMTADEVADQAVRAVGRRPVLVNGAMNSLTAGAMKLVPRSR